MDFITSYLIVKGNILPDSLLWLRLIHLPFIRTVDGDILIVFNINKEYLAEFIRCFNPSDWEYDSTFTEYPNEYKEVFDKVARTLCSNLSVYSAFHRKDAADAPFTNPQDDEKIFSKAFNGTGYHAWKMRWYLCRDGLNVEEVIDSQTEMVRSRYKKVLDEAIANIKTDIKGLKIDIYFDYTTFYVGWFVDSDEELSYIGASAKLKSLNDEMNRLIAEQGLKRNLHDRCGIPLYLRSIGINGVDYTFYEREQYGEEISDWAVIQLTDSNKLRDLQFIDSIPIYALDRTRNKVVLANVAGAIFNVLDISSSISFSRTHSPAKYTQLVADVERQMEYNKSLPFMLKLKEVTSRYNLDKLYEGMRGMNANKTDRKVIEDEPHRVESLQYDKEEEVAAIISKYLTEHCGITDPAVTYMPKVNFYNRLVESIFVAFPITDDFDKGDLAEWIKDDNLVFIGNEQANIVKFFRAILATIPELNKYFRII